MASYIHKLLPAAVFEIKGPTPIGIIGNDYYRIDWAGEEKIPLTQIKAKIKELEPLAAREEKRELRRVAYAEAGLTWDYWNEINVEGDQVAIDKFRADRQIVRAAIPLE